MMLTTMTSLPRPPPSGPDRGAFAAALGGTLHETFELALPRLVRRSRLYEATAKNLLRVTIELVGGVPAGAPVADEHEPDPGKLAVRMMYTRCMRRKQIYLDDASERALKRLSARTGRSEALHIREALQRYLADGSARTTHSSG